MRVERLTQDKIRFFLTFDDLMERGIEKNDMWRDVPKVHELFNEMMEHAYRELGFEVSGPVAVEVFALPAQGMVVIVTRGKTDHIYDEDAEYDEDIYEVEVTVEESDTIVYSFADFENVIEALHRIRLIPIKNCTLYSYQNRYFVLIEDDEELEDSQYEQLISILSEYGEASQITTYMLDEYGKLIVRGNGIETICKYFK